MNTSAISLPDLSASQAHLRLIQTTDLHLHVLGYDYFTDRALPGTGLARIATRIRALRASAGTSLLLDNGDFLQGTPLADWLAEEGRLGPGELHPMFGAMNALGYDGGTLGNHDFNYGLPFLVNALAGAAFPVVCANVLTARGAAPAEDTTLQPPWTVLDREVTTGDGRTLPLRIGLIGFAPPQTREWEQFSVGPRIDTRDIVAAALGHLPALRAASADIVVALAHSGIGDATHSPGMENAATALAALDGIDVVLAGHTHQRFPGPDIAPGPAVDPVAGTLAGKPAVMAGFDGGHFGLIDLVLDHGPQGWRFASHHGAVLTGRADDPDDPPVAAAVAPAHARVVEMLGRRVGQTEAPLHSHLALVGPSTALRVLADAMEAHARRCLPQRELASLPMVVAVAPSRSGGQGGPDNYVDIPAGPLSLRHAAELYHYPNVLCVLEVSGAEIRDWLEWSARLFLPLTPGLRDQPLIDPACPGYNFDTIFGLQYVIDPTQPPARAPVGGGGGRIGGLALADGRALAPSDRLLLVTNSYRASGGGGYGIAAADRIRHQCRRGLQAVVRSYMDGATLRPDPAPAWRFASHPGTTALFESGPDALHHLPAEGGPRLERARVLASGFHSYRLHL